jgi:hypothetical protein
MPVDLGAILANGAISQGLGFVLGNFFGQFGNRAQTDRTLTNFLKTLSTEFVNRVENVVRDAFTNQNFLEVKTDLRSAATAFRTYTASEELDKSQMVSACARVIDARSRLFSSAEALLAIEPGSFLTIADPAQKGSAITQRNRALEASMKALQAVAALDLLILAKKTEQFPGVGAEIVSRVNEYCHMADELKQTYLNHQSFRSWVKWEHQVKPMDGGGMDCIFHCTLYRDGDVVENGDQRLFHIPHGQVDQCKQRFEAPLKNKYGNDQTLYRAAKVKVSESVGNIDEAIRTWLAVKDIFAAQREA